jgi:predicted nucleic acid-binding protein
MAVYVLDTSAILAAFKGEPGNLQVRDILEAAEVHNGTQIFVPFLALMEVEYQFLRAMPLRDVEHWINVTLNWPIEVVESTPDWRGAAAAIKAVGKVCLADAWVAALALLKDAELIHKDPEFDAVVGLKHLRLPYDTPSTRGGRLDHSAVN